MKTICLGLDSLSRSSERGVANGQKNHLIGFGTDYALKKRRKEFPKLP